MPRRTAPAKRGIPNVKKVLAVASGKGGVGKSTISVNLASSLATLGLRVGLLDLDIFGPSIPTLMGLTEATEPHLTDNGALIPLTNHGIPTMSMGYLIPPSPDTAIVWRGLMVQKAAQQLLFDVAWTPSPTDAPLDILVLDMPPGTGDVPLTLGQLVNVDASVIVSTPQDVALADVRRGVAMFRKMNVPVTGIVLNQAHFRCGGCGEPHYLYGSPDGFRKVAQDVGVDVLAELPVVPGVSRGGDKGVPYALLADEEAGVGGKEWKDRMASVAGHVRTSLGF
ncbi:P-loop containing nucleoside triphosphate hydrolase protein [Cylindrobasidium torrendii FP15055 ss-10]|uniref:p-loop containing nucleoside triphosphate hydrolase protein n=1 Tax=Cylindrobasidium torrendii FP15055 ss-10 TaxID=1314674 RepID=A0A0D7B1Z4_9AGAR|nr:P-loop containing nucleoside triphosphate hydrolase protein [Cylindrobasidium torrendii FP15055 ss-10]